MRGVFALIIALIFMAPFIMAVLYFIGTSGCFFFPSGLICSEFKSATVELK